MVNPKISIDWRVQVEKRNRRNASNRTKTTILDISVRIQ